MDVGGSKGLRLLSERREDLSEDEYLRINTAGWDGIVDSYRNFTRDYWETKAVYAPVYPAVDKISFVPGQDSVRIPIQNDFDFTNLSSVKMAWSVREDENVLYSGTDSMYGYPHTVSDFKLPVEKLVTVRPGRTYYVWFIFTDEKGTEITRRAVELCLRQNNRYLFLFVVNFWLLRRIRLPLRLVMFAMCLVRRMDNWCLRN